MILLKQHSTAIAAIVFGTGAVLATSEPVSALGISFTGKTGDDYNYEVTLDSDDSLDDGTIFFAADILTFQNVFGVTGVDLGSQNTYDLAGFDSLGVNLEVGTAAFGPATIAFAITAPNTVEGPIDFNLTFLDNGIPVGLDSTMVSLNGPTEIPWETDVTLGLAVVGIAIGGHKWWKRRQNRASC